MLGGMWQCIELMNLEYWYNGLKGADSNCVTRNLINACEYMCFTSEVLQVASEPFISSLKPLAYQWLLVMGPVILTILQLQDMSDQEGDRLRRRWTVPLVVGDSAARWTIAILVGFWSWLCSAF